MGARLPALWIMRLGALVAAATLCAAHAVAAPASAVTTVTVTALTEAAAAAQAQCHPRIHHDTYAYEDCLLGLLASEKRPGPRRLGIEYFGYVGAMNSERLGMEGAAPTAFEFLRRFRRTQRRLQVDDATLCSTVPGDCTVRLARMKVMLAAPEFKQPVRRDRSSEHQHVH